MKKKFISLTLAIVLMFCCVVFAGCQGSKNTYNIYVKTQHYNLGSIEGGNGTYKEGEIVNIKAIPTTSSSTNSTFICWVLNNKIVSTQAEYSFKASSETAGTYTALFSCPYIEYFYLGNISLQMCKPLDVSDVQNDIVLTSIKIFAGKTEESLQNIYTYENEVVSNQSSDAPTISLLSQDIYSATDLPFAYDMQEDIILSIEVYYTQLENNYVSKTRAQISGKSDVTLETLTFDSSFVDGGGYMELEDANNVNSNTKLSCKFNSKIKLEFKRISEYFNPTSEEEE